MAFAGSHLADSVTVPEIAGAVGLSTQHLRRIFRTATGQSIYAQINRLRLDRAKSLLVATLLNRAGHAFGGHPSFRGALSPNGCCTCGEPSRTIEGLNGTKAFMR